jgi:RNA 3'-terminal phosphate cyclase (ATP)
MSGDYHFSIGTAGATGLVLHTLYLPLALHGSGPSRLTLVGGTHVSANPCFHFLDTTWRPYMGLLGINVQLGMVRPGFYPRGRGVIVADIIPSSGMRGLVLPQRGLISRATAFGAVASLPESIADRQTRRTLERLRGRGIDIAIHNQSWTGGPGTVLAITLQTTPVPTMFFGLGARGKPAEKVADEAVDQALAYLDAETAFVDPHSADQLVLPLAIVDGPSNFGVTQVTAHLQTNIGVIRRFVDRAIVCRGQAGEPGVVKID